MDTLRAAAQQALENICGAKLCEVNSMSSRMEMLRLMDNAITALRAALAQPAVSGEPVAHVSECEACFTPDACQLRGTCDHYAAEKLRIAAAPQPAPARQPLTLEQINRIEMAAEWPEGSLRNIGPRDWGRLLVCAVRAIEAAHGITAGIGAPDAKT